MRQCWYCGKWFKNKQALIAHLRFCRERDTCTAFQYGKYAKNLAVTYKVGKSEKFEKSNKV